MDYRLGVLEANSLLNLELVLPARLEYSRVFPRERLEPRPEKLRGETLRERWKVLSDVRRRMDRPRIRAASFVFFLFLFLPPRIRVLIVIVSKISHRRVRLRAFVKNFKGILPAVLALLTKFRARIPSRPDRIHFLPETGIRL